MNMKNAIVIGNKFKQFADGCNVMTVSQIKNSYPKTVLPKREVIIGQGLSKDDLGHLNDDVDIDTAELLYLTHKHQQKNVLITPPIQSTTVEYRCQLRIDEDCAEMSDHQTGQHIQGGLLLEAARQMLIAVNEKFIFSKNNKGNMSFITNTVEIKYESYIFPLPVNMALKFLKIKQGRGSNVTASVSIKLFQNNIQAAEIIFGYSALNSSFVKSREKLFADKAIEEFVRSSKDQIGDLYAS
jgi:hypothetical protein